MSCLIFMFAVLMHLSIENMRSGSRSQTNFLKFELGFGCYGDIYCSPVSTDQSMLDVLASFAIQIKQGKSVCLKCLPFLIEVYLMNQIGNQLAENLHVYERSPKGKRP